MNPHLPAGQPMPGGVGAAGVGPGGRGPVDVGSVQVQGPHTGNGPRRRPQYASHPHNSYTHHNPHTPIYYNNSHMNPYANAYYPQGPFPYSNPSMPTTAPYMPYNANNVYATLPARSPPAMHQQYPPIVSSNMSHPPPQPYARPPQQHSPAISTPPPYQTAPLPPPVPIPHTPSSTHSSQVAPPASLTPPISQPQEVVPPQPEVEVVPTRPPFRAPLPWLSHPDLPFPTRSSKLRRRRRNMTTENEGVQLPTNQQAGVENSTAAAVPESSAETAVPEPSVAKETEAAEAPPSATKSIERPETPSTQDLPSEGAQSTTATTPISVQTTQLPAAANATPTQPPKLGSRAAAPAVPAVPVLPKASPKDARTRSTSSAEQLQAPEQKKTELEPSPEKPVDSQGGADSTATDIKPEPAPASTKPKSWANLFTKETPAAAAASTDPAAPSVSMANGGSSTDGAAIATSSVATGGFAKSNASSLAEALGAFRATGNSKLAFLEPRGLINTGNMCYMNSVLQVLIFCIPFYDFLDQVSKKAVHSFDSETPSIDAMINFMREYNVIDSAVSADQLRRRLKNEELEQYGEPFTPEFVYEAIRKLPRFASMRRGHQQDAEEFLGFLLEGLHDECAQVMRHLPDTSMNSTAANSSVASPTAVSPIGTTESNTWLEVGRKQRAAITRSSGHPVASSPITKIFGGQLRSELRVAGKKDSVTLEPYQPLQLDIGSPQVRNIVDALKNLNRPETLHGDFNSPRGPGAVATKQVFIETIPPVLILHLKRFQFNADGTGTAKIWKKVGYPLELEIPKEVLARQKRNSLIAEGAGFPRYRLTAVVYHHGQNASGGHYTVDVRRQDGQEWIRLDDTVIRRVRSEDVAQGGVEEDTSKQTAWSDKKDTVSGSGNRFEGIGDEDSGDDDEGWNKVSAPTSGTKKWSSVVNGGAINATSAPKAPKDNIRDNRVAYLLFYQQIV